MKLNLHLIIVGENTIENLSCEDETTHKSGSATSKSTKKSHSTTSTVTQSNSVETVCKDSKCEDTDILTQRPQLQISNNDIHNIIPESFQKEDFKNFCATKKKRKVDRKDHKHCKTRSKHLKCDENESLHCTNQKLEENFIENDYKLQSHEENGKVVGNIESSLNGSSNGSCTESSSKWNSNLQEELPIESKERIATIHLDTGCKGGEKSNKETKLNHITELFVAQQHNPSIEIRKGYDSIELQAKRAESKDEVVAIEPKEELNTDDKEETDVTKFPFKPQIFDRMRISLVKKRKKRESKKKRKKQEEITREAQEEICIDKNNGRSTFFNKLRLGKKKEAHGEKTEVTKEKTSNLQTPPEIETTNDNVNSFMKKGAKSWIKGIKSKKEKEQESKEQMQKQHKKEEKEKKKKEDKKRKLKERYEKLMSKQSLANFDLTNEFSLQCYGERKERVEQIDSSRSSSSLKGSFGKGSLKHADCLDMDYAKSRERATSTAWVDASVAKNSIDDGKANRITTLFAAKEHNSAIENSRRNSLSELTTMENGCKANRAVKKMNEDTQKNNNYMDRERMKRIVEMFAAKEHNAALLKSRASKANGLNTMGNGHKPDGNEVIELNHNFSKNDDTDSKLRSVVGYTKTPLETTEHENYSKAVSKQNNVQKQRLKKYAMQLTVVDTC